MNFIQLHWIRSFLNSGHGQPEKAPVIIEKSYNVSDTASLVTGFGE